jgi:acyl carrier protein
MSDEAAHRYVDGFVDVLRFAVTDPEQQVSNSSAKPASESSEPRAAATTLSAAHGAEGGTDPSLPSPLEPEVLAVWSRILGREVTEATTTFLEAGGDSLQLLDLYLQLRKAFQADFPMRVLFRYPTARSFAHFIAAAG